MATKFVPVILSGGSGSRLWPSSRSLYPKQFLKLVSEKTMLQETASRLASNKNATPPVIVCNVDHRFLVAEQLREINVTPSNILLEPEPKNTAPAIALSALNIMEEHGDAVMLVLPADHIIEDTDSFHSAINVASEQCNSGQLVTFGIVPNKAETGYGYIKAGKAINEGVHKVDSFVEKPNLETAKKYISSGNYSWNSGMFMFKASDYISELEKTDPKIIKFCKEALKSAKKDLDFLRVDSDSFAKCPSNSIDYAVMEKTQKSVVLPINIGWNDIGSWSALWEAKRKDEQGNSIEGDVMAVDTENCFIKSDKKLIATLGVKDIVLVETDDTILLADKKRSQEVKTFVELLKSNDRSEAKIHRKVYRPWGYYDSIEYGDNFQVKRLVVNPGAQLSLQMHHHRAEHWVVVKGTAEVINGNKKILLKVNESTYIPIGTQHQLSNPGKLSLELIEVQSGAYLGEDDIVRFEDAYGRIES